jgi:ubiquinone/menaquinone biosynthesis C-methylase UbiE
VNSASGDKKAWIAGIFDRAAETYDLVGTSYHAEFGRRLVDKARLPAGGSVLDVACGKGAVLIPAAAVVGPQGRAIGTDISTEMVRLVVEEAIRMGRSNCEGLVMDAEYLAFEDATFGSLFCAFGLFFLPDPARAAGEFARVLGPGGSLAVSTWGDQDPRWTWEDELFGLDVERRPISQPFATSESLHDLLRDAGFHDVRIDSEACDIYFRDEEEWWAWKWSFSLRGVLEQLGADSIDALKSRAFELMRPQRGPHGYQMRLNARFALATRP